LRAADHGSAGDALVAQYSELRAAFEPEEDAPEDAPENAPEDASEDASNEGAKSNMASAAYDIAVPLTGTVQAWFPQARMKLRQMTESGSSPADFKRFRQANARSLEELKRAFRSWYSILDKVIIAGETGQ
jgi:hypothetical protein